MSKLTRTSTHGSSRVEPLEARIAPAVLVNGANLLGGAGNPSVGEVSLGDNSAPLIKVTSGQALVWFDNGHITSVSFSDGASFELFGTVGSLIGNLRSDGRLSDSDNNPLNGEDGNVLLPNNLTGLKVNPFGAEKGNIGYVITGGSVSNVNVTDELEGIYAGDGAFHSRSDITNSGAVVVNVGFDTNPLLAGEQDEFVFTRGTASMKAGATIKNVTVGLGRELQIISGGGNPALVAAPTVAGGAGGNIESIVIKSAVVDPSSDPTIPAFALITGDGGNGKTGGAGGHILNVLDESSAGGVLLLSGHGGAGGAGKGGDGGSIKVLDMRSESSRYTITGGNGGAGAPGGAGGSIVNSNFANLTPSGGIIKAGDFNGDGEDDLLAVDISSGGMVILANNGGAFTPITQYVNDDLDPVTVISAAGNIAADAAVSDVDDDGDLDIAVAYKASGSLAVFFNNGNGTFWNATDEEFVNTSATLKFTPAFLAPAQVDGGAMDFVVIENQTNKSIIHRVLASSDLANLTFSVDDISQEHNSEATDLVAGTDGLLPAYVSYKDGRIGIIDSDGAVTTGSIIPGGIAGLDLNEEGNQLLALGSNGRSIALLDVSAGTPFALAAPVITGAGRALVAQFVHDGDEETQDQIAILMAEGGSARIDLFAPGAGEEGWASAASVTSASPLKNFVAAYNRNFDGDIESFGFGALGAAINELHFSPSGGTFTEYALPFVGKQVVATGGDGGQGLNLGRLIGKGGAGGSITNINSFAQDIQLFGGDGGDAATGGGGAGGSISSGGAVPGVGAGGAARLVATSTLALESGDGGSTLGAGGKKGTGGAAGGISGIRGELAEGEISVVTGNGGAGNGAAGGAGGSVNRVELVSKGGNLVVSTGNGGSTSGVGAVGGAGGSVNGLSYNLTLISDAAEELEQSYFAAVAAGAGGASPDGTGGAGGNIAGLSITADPADRSYNDPTQDPPKVDAHLDTTFYFSAAAGNGANGRNGGIGGSVKDLNVLIVHDQTPEDGSIYENYAIANVQTGAGGNGTAGNGGAGGSVANARFVGLTYTDPDAAPQQALVVVARNGGTGTIKGGAGGGVAGLLTANAQGPGGGLVNFNMLTDAIVIGGDGGHGGSGDGGAGGALSGLRLSVDWGAIVAVGGDGGNSASAKGGAGGGMKDATLALVSTFFNQGILLVTGDAGSGATAGGAGGSFLNINLNAPIGRIDDYGDQSTLGRPISIYAGAGGDASASGGKAGPGGDVTGITQAKDVFSPINVISAGDGGTALTGVGGRGGNVTNVRTVGFIGKPAADGARLGVFDDLNEPQGLFVGRGGAGATAGVNGNVTSVVARQIAAIAANAVNGVFAPATKVSNVKADVIGYDVDLDGLFDGATTNPGTGIPVDGFLFAKTITGVTGSRPAFTFTA